MLHAATALNDLNLPGNHLEALVADRKGQHSIRINTQWRVCFKWAAPDAHDVEIVDYLKSGQSKNVADNTKANALLQVADRKQRAEDSQPRAAAKARRSSARAQKRTVRKPPAKPAR